VTAAAILDPFEELTLEDRKGRGLVLEAFDRVYLKGDSRKDLGHIVSDEGGSRYFVRWDNGRTWIYASEELVVLMPVAS